MEFREYSYIITGACYEVSHELGIGFLEKVYEAALIEELKQRGLMPQQQQAVTVYYKGKPLDIDYRADIIVNNEVIIELKVIDEITNIQKAQLLNYMKATHIKYGMLINFGKAKVEIERFVI